jgi:hypothetical protein
MGHRISETRDPSSRMRCILSVLFGCHTAPVDFARALPSLFFASHLNSHLMLPKCFPSCFCFCTQSTSSAKNHPGHSTTHEKSSPSLLRFRNRRQLTQDIRRQRYMGSTYACKYMCENVSDRWYYVRDMEDGQPKTSGEMKK